MTEQKQKFFSLGYGLAVALQSNIPMGEPAGRFLRAFPPPAGFNQGKGQIFHPAEKETKGPVSKVVFKIATNGEEGRDGVPARQLVFRAKQWTVAGRFGETSPFGFDKTNPTKPETYKGVDHLLLAFPGITGVFTPLYLKVRTREMETIYLMVKAYENADGINVVMTET
ncbi:MAG: hypothetical protein ABII97_00205, partial [Patescibacteria group bacterium]